MRYPLVHTIPKPLKFDESEYEPVMRGRRAKRGATITEVDGSGSDRALGGSPRGSRAEVAGPSNEEEKLMGELADKQAMMMGEMMLPGVKSRPGGNSIAFIC